jgi:hypothetical protein
MEFFVILTFMSPKEAGSGTSPFLPSTAYICTLQQTNFQFLGARESLENKLGKIFRRRTLRFPSLTICIFSFIYCIHRTVQQTHF